MRIGYTLAMAPGAVLGVIFAIVSPHLRPAPPPPPVLGDCRIADEAGRLSVFEAKVEGLQLCAARLEVFYVRDQKPVRGAFGQTYIQIDAAMIGGSASPTGPFLPLFDPWGRQEIDAAIRPMLRFERDLSAAWNR